MEEQKEQPVQLPKLEISMNDDGSISVNGPIANKALCYGLLGMARDALFEYHLKKATDKPIHRVLNFVRGK